MKVVCLFSGGKDSVFAVGWALFQGFEINLLSIQSKEYGFMFHHPNIKWTKLQAKAMDLPYFLIKTNEKNELKDMKDALAQLNAEAILTGAIASEYQKQRIEQTAEELEIPVYAPLWHKEEVLLKEMLSNFEIYTVAVSAEGLGKEFLAKPFSDIIKKNVKNIHPFLEGGEGETFVAYAPFFQKRIIIKEWVVAWDGIRGTAEIKKAHLKAL